jgi:hypothetical protein
LFRPEAAFELAMQLRTPKGAPIADVFSFLSGLYFRGKVAYARAFASPPRGVRCLEPAYVITPSRGLLPMDMFVTIDELLAMAEVPIDLDEPRYVEPMRRSVEALAAKVCGRGASGCEVVLLGSIATGKYVDLLLPALGDRLKFPSEFVGRGDMSRGGLMLRCVDERRPLTYISIDGAQRRGPRPAKLLKRDPTSIQCPRI